MGRFWKKGVILAALCLSFLGCAPEVVPETTAPTSPTMATKPQGGTPGQTDAARILSTIWAEYEPVQRFSSYGGMMEHPVENAPGDLNMELPMLWMPRYRIPLAHLEKLEQGASLSHLLNEKLLTAVVFRLDDQENMAAVARDWRWELQHSHWAAGRPNRLLLAQVEGDFLLMAFGSREQMQLLGQKLRTAYPKADVLHDEPITA